MLDVDGNYSPQGQAPRVGSADARIAELARRQHGVVNSLQLRLLGVTKEAVTYRVRVGRLHRIHRGVYAVGHRSLPRPALFMAAVLAVGGDAALSHRSAAVHWGLLREEPKRAIDVSTRRSLRRRHGIRIHTVRSLGPDDVVEHAAIRVTSPARTLLDLADVAGARVLRRAVREAEVQRLVHHRQLRGQVRRAAGRRGAGGLAALIADGPTPTRSDLEDAAIDLFRRNGLKPQINAKVVGLEVDFFFPAGRLVVEADGDWCHGTRLARSEDARKQATLEAAGYRVVRINWDQATLAGPQTVRRIRSALP